MKYNRIKYSNALCSTFYEFIALTLNGRLSTRTKKYACQLGGCVIEFIAVLLYINLFYVPLKLNFKIEHKRLHRIVGKKTAFALNFFKRKFIKYIIKNNVHLEKVK